MITISASEQDLVKKTTYETFKKLGITEEILRTRFEFSIKWSNRFTRVMGQARFKPVNGNYNATINFSTKLWHLASPEERRDTVIHEVCHVVANFRAKETSRPYPEDHGATWRSLMMKAGINNPQRYHTVHYKKSSSVEGKCGCRVHYLSSKMAKKIKTIPGYYVVCTLCKTHIVLNEK